jgi:glucose-6-phosphate isomerase
MDEHFQKAPWEQNLPLLLALVGIWNNNFLKASTHNVAPYSYLLSHFTPYLQQLEMESNGKGVDHQMNPMQVNTAPIVWGGLGIDGQHAYFQLLHQGSHLVSVDFIGLKKDDCPLEHAQAHHECLVLNMKAQAKALAHGRSLEDTQKELEQSGLLPEEIEQLAGHRTFRGNSPSTSIWLDEMNPKILGTLMALYEHKVFAQAAIWSINPFDQWGVELGKKIAQQLKND